MGNKALESRAVRLTGQGALLAAFDESAGARCYAKARRLHQLADTIGEAVEGTVLTAGGTRYASITPDVEPGMSRYTCFDERGPFSHGVYCTPEEALMACFDMGYEQIAAPQELDALAQQWA